MKNKILLALLLFTLFFVSCSRAGGQTINSPEALKEYLDKQPANGPDKPIKVSMAANELMFLKIVKALNSAGKYVSLNLTGNALTVIPEYAFVDEEKREFCKTLVSITIPSSVTGIGTLAFSGCTNLKSITIPNSVTEIGEGAFANCTSFTSITIPNNVTEIGEGAFYYCTSINNIIIGAAMPHVKSNRNKADAS